MIAHFLFYSDQQLSCPQIGVWVISKLLAEDQNAVERRPQLVRHICKKFGLVSGSERQLLRLLFQSPAGLFNLLILALDLGILLGELFGFLRELLVSLL